MKLTHILAHRIYFLRSMKPNRDGDWDIVYMNESYVNSGHTVNRYWQTD